jgi:transcriptional regulator of acetoin/glycerol metabolism
MEALTKAHWPGNVADLRELVIAASAGGRPSFGLGDLTQPRREQLARGRLTRLEAAELEQIRHALMESGGNKVEAAEELEIARSTLYRKINLYTRQGFDLG